jgi:hypothetical protein
MCVCVDAGFQIPLVLGRNTAEPVLNAARIASVTAELSARALNKSRERMIVAVRRKASPAQTGSLFSRLMASPVF